MVKISTVTRLAGGVRVLIRCTPCQKVFNCLLKVPGMVNLECGSLGLTARNLSAWLIIRVS